MARKFFLVCAGMLLALLASDAKAAVIADFGSCQWQWLGDNGVEASCAPFVVSPDCALPGTPIILESGYVQTTFTADIPGVIVTYTVKMAGFALAIANGIEGNSGGSTTGLECPPPFVLTGGFPTRVGTNIFRLRTYGAYYDAKLESVSGITPVRSLSWGKLKLIYR
jgi:hypothetical protein